MPFSLVHGYRALKGYAQGMRHERCAAYAPDNCARYAPEDLERIAPCMRRRFWGELHRVCAGGFGANCAGYVQDIRGAIPICTEICCARYAPDFLKLIAPSMRRILLKLIAPGMR